MLKFSLLLLASDSRYADVDNPLPPRAAAAGLADFGERVNSSHEVSYIRIIREDRCSEAAVCAVSDNE
jgi:hypothetical protein